MPDPTQELQLEATEVPFGDDLEIVDNMDEAETIGVTSLDTLQALVVEWRLIRHDGAIPETYRNIRTGLDSGNLECYTIVELADDEYAGLGKDAFESAIRAVYGSGGFPSDEITLYAPSKSLYPFVFTTETAPDEFLISQACGGREAFAEEFGGTACIGCETIWDEPRLYCPECGEYPAAVESNLEKIREQHPGVAVMVTPRLNPDVPAEDDSVGIEDAISGYKTSTGDEHLLDEDQLDQFLGKHGFI